MAPLGVAGQGAGGAGAGAAPAAGGQCWVCVETAEGWTRGEIIVHDPNPLPAGHLSVGDKAVVPAKDASGVPVFVKRVGVAEAPSLKLEDLRTLPVQFVCVVVTLHQRLPAWWMECHWAEGFSWRGERPV